MAPPLRCGRAADRGICGDLRRRTTSEPSNEPLTSAGSTSTKMRANARERFPPASTASTPTCCSTTPTPSTMPLPSPTRWAIRCTPCCPTRPSRLPPPPTRSSSPKWRRMTNESLFLDLLLGRGIRRSASGRSASARHRRHRGRLLPSNDVCRLRASRPTARSRTGAADHRRSAAEVLPGTLEGFFGDSLDDQEWYRNTWARIPHFFGSPYYVYQYATSKAAASLLHRKLVDGRGHRMRRHRRGLPRVAEVRRQRPSDFTPSKSRRRLHHYRADRSARGRDGRPGGSTPSRDRKRFKVPTLYVQR